MSSFYDDGDDDGVFCVGVSSSLAQQICCGLMSFWLYGGDDACVLALQQQIGCQIYGDGDDDGVYACASSSPG